MPARAEVFIARLRLTANVGSYQLERMQLPVRLAYAMTIHKSQGLLCQRFYISRGTRPDGLKWAKPLSRAHSSTVNYPLVSLCDQASEPRVPYAERRRACRGHAFFDRAALVPPNEHGNEGDQTAKWWVHQSSKKRTCQRL